MLRSLLTIAILLATCAISVAQDMPLTQVLLSGEDWELVGEGYKFTEAPAVDGEGNVFFSDVPAGDIFKIDLDGKLTKWIAGGERVSGLMFGPKGKLYACQNQARKIAIYDKTGEFTVLADDIDCNDLVVGPAGDCYVTDPKNHRVWHITADGTKRVVDEGIERPNGIILWPDGRTLVVADSAGDHLWTFRVENDGSLKFKQPYYTVRLAQGATASRADGMTVDSAGRLYVATEVGLQMFDPTARLGGVIHKPQKAFLANVVLGGSSLDTLYVTCADKVYRRASKVTGVRYR